MSRNYWCAAVVLGLAISTSALAQEVAPEQPVEPSPTQEQPAEQPAIEAEPVAPAVAPTEPASTTADTDNASNGETSPNDSLFWGDGIAQWIMAFAGVAALAISVWAVCLVGRSLKLTRELAIADRRPWISEEVEIKPQDVGFFEEDGSWVIALTVWAENVGQHPALEVSVSQLFEVGFYDHSAVANAIIASNLQQRPGGKVVFPNNRAGLDGVLVLKAQPGPAWGQFHTGNFGGWIEYRFAGSPDRHITPFVYGISVQKPRAEAETYVSLTPRGHDIPAT